MEEFEVVGTPQAVIFSESIEAETREQAYAKFKKLHPNCVVDAIGDDTVIGEDEGSGEPIFEGDDYVCDEDGCYTLAKNMTQEEYLGGYAAPD